MRLRLPLLPLVALGVTGAAVALAQPQPPVPVGAGSEGAGSAGPVATAAPVAPPPAGEAQAPRAAAPQVPKLERVARPRGASLRECLGMAERNYPKVSEAAAQLARMRAQVFEVRTAPFSGFQATAGVGFAPTVEGTSVYSPSTDSSLTSSMALAWRVGIDGAIPLFTFGKISGGIDAAVAQAQVGEHALRKAKNEIRLSVRQAYYGVQLARDAGALVDEALQRVDKYLPKAEAKVEQGEGDDIELLKLKIHRAELDARRSEARKQERLALAGLRFFTGGGPGLDVPDTPLVKATHHLGPLPRYLAAARLFRPEVNMAHAGARARAAQREIERARLFPDLALALSASRSYAPEVADQVNPYVRDEGNYTRYSAGLVLKWNLDFLPRAAKLAQAEAQLEEMRATERFALGGVAVEVESAFAEATESARRLEAYTEATRYAKQWLVKVQQGIDVGTFEEEDIVDPAKEYALKRFAQMTATYDHNVALAKLALTTGWDAVAPE